MMAGASRSGSQGLEQRDDVDPADPVAGPEQPGLARQQQDLQQVGRLGRRADDVRAQRPRGTAARGSPRWSGTSGPPRRSRARRPGGSGSAAGSTRARAPAARSRSSGESSRYAGQTPAQRKISSSAWPCRSLCCRRSSVSMWTPKTSTSRIMSRTAPTAAASAPSTPEVVGDHVRGRRAGPGRPGRCPPAAGGTSSPQSSSCDRTYARVVRSLAEIIRHLAR